MHTVVVVVILVVVTLSLIVKLYFRVGRRGCTCQSSLVGKTAIVTGANTGIGYYTARDLAKRGAHVILACRDPARGKCAVQMIAKDTGSTKVTYKHLDLSELSSVQRFASEVTNEEDRLDILVNNAAVNGLTSRRQTEDGLEYTFATNYFGPFLLTNLLLDLLKSSKPSRIVNVSSFAHHWGSIEFDNLRAEKSYRVSHVYFASKLAVVLFTMELAKRLYNTGVTANSLHPGTVRTDAFRNMPRIARLLLSLAGMFFFKTAEEGAQTTIHCAVSEKVSKMSGLYFCECRPTIPARQAQDEGVASKLWVASEKLTGLRR